LTNDPPDRERSNQFPLFAGDGIEALAMLEANGDINMVVTDINMPRMGGLTLLEKFLEGAENVSAIICRPMAT
jgi:CheY-like chemotaxis protein